MALISDQYRDLNAQMHLDEPRFGAGSVKFVGKLKELMHRYGNDVLDYGCGKGGLSKAINTVRGYDPAIQEFSELPRPADLVICRDVMEHVEEDCIDDVLDHIKWLSREAAYFVIVCGESKETLPDGRNAHISIYPPEWWIEKLKLRFRSVSHTINGKELSALCV